MQWAALVATIVVYGCGSAGSTPTVKSYVASVKRVCERLHAAEGRTIAVSYTPLDSPHVLAHRLAERLRRKDAVVRRYLRELAALRAPRASVAAARRTIALAYRRLALLDRFAAKLERSPAIVPAGRRTRSALARAVAREDAAWRRLGAPQCAVTPR